MLITSLPPPFSNYSLTLTVMIINEQHAVFSVFTPTRNLCSSEDYYWLYTCALTPVDLSLTHKLLQYCNVRIDWSYAEPSFSLKWVPYYYYYYSLCTEAGSFLSGIVLLRHCRVFSLLVHDPLLSFEVAEAPLSITSGYE